MKLSTVLDAMPTLRVLVLMPVMATLVRMAQPGWSRSHPPGLDGYYYVVQIEDLWQTGQLHVPDSSWVLSWLAAFMGLTRDPILAHWLGACALAGACVAAAWAVGRHHSRNLAWALLTWAAVSPTLQHLAADFAKNLGVAAPGLAWAASWSLLGRGPRRSALGIVLLVGLGLLTATAHRLGAVFIALALVGLLLGSVGRRVELRLPAWAPPAALLVGVLLFSALSLSLPGLLHPDDLVRLKGQLALEPGLPSPLPWAALRPTHPAELIELSLPWAALGLAAWQLARAPERRPAATAALLCLAPILLVPWRRDVLDMGYRLSLMGPLVSVAALPWLLPPLTGRLAPRLLSLSPGLCIFMPLAWVGHDPAQRPDHDRYQALIDAIPRPLPELLIAHQGINFLYDYRTGEEAMAWAPEAELDPTTVGRLAWGIEDRELLAWLPTEAEPLRLDTDYVYLREDAWRTFVAAARTEGDDDLHERLSDPRNPSALRPASLTGRR